MLHYQLQLALDVCFVFLANDVTQVIAHSVQPLVGRILQKKNPKKQPPSCEHIQTDHDHEVPIKAHVLEAKCPLMNHTTEMKSLLFICFGQS